MAYWLDYWSFPNSIEYEMKFAGNYGAKGEKRGARKKATPEQIKKQNQINREKRMRRLIKANFLPNDLWASLKYPEGLRKPLEQIKIDLRQLLAGMRKEYKKRDEPFKFVYRMEIGKHGGIHVHILTNRSRVVPATDILLQEMWPHGRVNHQSIYEYGGYEKLAVYIVKQPDEEIEGQLSLFEKKEQKELIKYSSSRNLVRPEPERKEYRRWTVRRLMEYGPIATPGYYIDKNSITFGVNKYTGMSYYQYTECRIAELKAGTPEWEDWDRERRESDGQEKQIRGRNRNRGKPK